jgi:hypothetical protein
MNAHPSGTAPAPSGGSGHQPLQVIAVASAVVGQAVVLVPFTVASGLVAPWPAIALLHALWLVMAWALWLVARRQPLAAPLVPLANAGLLFGLITVGETVLGWTG